MMNTSDMKHMISRIILCFAMFTTLITLTASARPVLGLCPNLCRGVPPWAPRVAWERGAHGGTPLQFRQVRTLLVLEQSSDEREFVGTINNTLRVRIKLSQSGKTLSGSYAYERIGKGLRLNGAMTSENEFYLNEFDERGRQTGKFDGKFVSKDWIEGTWVSTTNKKEMPFSAWAVDGKEIPTADSQDRVSGQYKRVDQRGRFDRDSAELNVWLLKDGQVRVAGDATWVGNASTGNVNVGQVDGIFALQGNKLFLKSGDGDDDCRFTITFGVNSLVVSEDNLKCGGLNVSFDGKYRKVGPAKAE